MIKPSEYSPITSALMKSTLEAAFDPDELAVFTGGPTLGAFSGLLRSSTVYRSYLGRSP